MRLLALMAKDEMLFEGRHVCLSRQTLVGGYDPALVVELDLCKLALVLARTTLRWHCCPHKPSILELPHLAIEPSSLESIGSSDTPS